MNEKRDKTILMTFYKCDTCKCLFDDEASLLDHEIKNITHRTGIYDLRPKCSKCGRPNMSWVESKDIRIYTCNICGYMESQKI